MNEQIKRLKELENCADEILKERKRSPFQRCVMRFAAVIDDGIIWFYNWKGNADGPCGKLQTWARQNRRIFDEAPTCKPTESGK